MGRDGVFPEKFFGYVHPKWHCRTETCFGGVRAGAGVQSGLIWLPQPR